MLDRRVQLRTSVLSRGLRVWDCCQPVATGNPATPTRLMPMTLMPMTWATDYFDRRLNRDVVPRPCARPNEEIEPRALSIGARGRDPQPYREALAADR